MLSVVIGLPVMDSAFSLVWNNIDSGTVKVDVTMIYGRKKISESVRIKQIAYNDSDDSELASDSDTEKRFFLH